MKDVNILLNFNDSYVQHACVMLCSLFENNPLLNGRINVFVASLGLSPKSKQMLMDFVKKYKNYVAFYDIRVPDVTLPNLTNHYVSIETYLRLFSIDYLPNTVGRILYLDVDMLVVGKIDELYSTDLEGNAIAAVEDSYFEGRSERLSIPADCGYFNAGMLLIDVEYWRTNDCTVQAVNFLRHHSDLIVQHDQDVLNSLFYDKRLRLDFKWNMMTSFYKRRPSLSEKYISELNKAKGDVRIAHFTGDIKPWQAWMRHPYFSDYYKYLSMTPYQGFTMSLKSQWTSRKFPRNLCTILRVDRVANRLIMNWLSK